MNKILLIGNSGLKSKVNDGQTVKVRLYHKKMIDEGCEVLLVDLDGFFRHPFSILHKIKTGIKKCDRVVLLAAERGERVLIPFINLFNKKYKKIFVMPLIGIGVLHSLVDKLSETKQIEFFSANDYNAFKKKKSLTKQLDKINCILPETELISHIYKNYFYLDNVVTLNNFRDYDSTIVSDFKPSKCMRVAYISRVWREKGIFDLLDVVKVINNDETKIELDIYGPKTLNNDEEIKFNSYMNSTAGVKYVGVIKENDVITTLSNYDLLAFPTRYFGEGTPGIISESLMAGTPIISSDFLQASYLLKNSYDSIIYKLLDKNDLLDKLSFLLENRTILQQMRTNALDSGTKFTYSYNRKTFLKYVCGIDDFKANK